MLTPIHKQSRVDGASVTRKNGRFVRPYDDVCRGKTAGEQRIPPQLLLFVDDLMRLRHFESLVTLRGHTRIDWTTAATRWSSFRPADSPARFRRQDEDTAFLHRVRGSGGRENCDRENLPPWRTTKTTHGQRLRTRTTAMSTE